MSFAITAAVIAVVGAGLSAYSASEQADASKKQANYQAQVARNSALVAENNAKISLQQRSDALQRGDITAHNAMRAQADLIGKQRASLAGNGVDLNEGSAQDLLASTRFLGKEDVSTIQSNAAREAWGYEVQGMNYDAQAMNFNAGSVLEKWKADNTNPAAIGAMAGASSLLSSAGAYASAGAAGGSGSGKSGTVSSMKTRSTGGSGW